MPLIRPPPSWTMTMLAQAMTESLRSEEDSLGWHFVLSRRPLAHFLARDLAVVSSVVHRPLAMKPKFTSVLA